MPQAGTLTAGRSLRDHLTRPMTPQETAIAQRRIHPHATDTDPVFP